MNVEKQKLRQKLLSERLAIPDKIVAEKSTIIRQKLLDLVNWEQIGEVHIYSSVSDWNEVDTAKIKKIIKTRWPDITINSPPSNKTEPIPIEKFDLIIVPVLGFDKDNYRLGLGGGWYDRFLAGQPQAQIIGLAYKQAELPRLPHEPHDIRLDKIITEV